MDRIMSTIRKNRRNKIKPALFAAKPAIIKTTIAKEKKIKASTRIIKMMNLIEYFFFVI